MSSPIKTSAPAAAPPVPSFEERLLRLEQKLDLELSPPSTSDAASGRLRDLAATVHDLARQQQILRRDLESLFEALERDPEGSRPPVDAETSPSRAAALGPADSVARRAARWLLRNTLGRARTLWHSADPHRPPPLELIAGDAVPIPGPLPISAPVGIATADAFGSQTHPPVLRAETSGDPNAFCLLEAPSPAITQLQTLWELLAWTLATEPLSFLELRFAAGARILLAAGPGNKAAVGKTLCLPHDAPPRSLGPELASRFRPSAHPRYSVPRKGNPPRVHRISPLRPPTSGQRPSRRLLLLEAPLDRDVAEWCAAWMHTHGGPEGWLLASTVPSHEAQVRRLLSLEALGALCYPLADFFEPELRSSVLEALLALYSVPAFTRLGEGPSSLPDFSTRNDLERHDFDLSEPENLPFETPLPSSRPPAEARLRQELGVGPGETLVAQTCDLERSRRPQDFLLLAHHLREDDRFFFLLCGEGAAEGTVADLEGYLRLPRYRRLASPPRHDVLAAADVVTSTAERLPLPYDLAAARAAGRPVVAFRAPGLERLGDVRSCAVGDLAALAESLREIADLSRPVAD